LKGAVGGAVNEVGHEEHHMRIATYEDHGQFADGTRDEMTQRAAYQPMFDNARKIRDLVSELHDLSLELVEPASARPKPKPPTTTKATSPKTNRPRASQATKRQG